jgi:hypothetical protein
MKSHTQRTIYHLIVDKSGSMFDSIPQTIEGFNGQVARIARLTEEFPEQQITIGLTLFDHEVTCLFSGKDPGQTPLLDRLNYIPSGSTALLDAIGITLSQLEAAKTEAERHLPTTVVLVIITDGHENASNRHTFKDIRNRIDKLQATGHWTFTYLGATLDAVEVAESLAINAQNSKSFDKHSMLQDVYGESSDSLYQYMLKKRRGQPLNAFFTKAEPYK